MVKTKAQKQKAKAKLARPKTKSSGAASQRKMRGSTGRVSRSTLRNHPIFGSGNFVSNSETVPAAFVNYEGNVTFCKQTGAVQHPFMGICGIALSGCQPFTTVTTEAAANGVFTATSLATLDSVNKIALNPDRFNGPLAAQANLHERYVFRDLLFEYVSAVATTQAGAISLGVMNDASALGDPTTFATVRQMVPSCTFPFRTDRSYLHYHYDGLELYWTAFETTALADIRQTCQGAIFGFPNITSIGAIAQGYINVYYVIELFQPVNSQGFTLGLRSQEESSLVMEYLKRIRREKLLMDAADSDFDSCYAGKGKEPAKSSVKSAR